MLKLNLHRFKKTDSLKSQMEDLGEEIQALAPSADVSLSLEPQSRKDGRRQKIFRLSVQVRQARIKVFLSRTGEHVYPLIMEMKHEVVRKLRALKEKKITQRAHRTSLAHYQIVNASVDEAPAL